MQKGSQMKPLSSYESGQAMLPPIPAKYPFPPGFISKGTNLTNCRLVLLDAMNSIAVLEKSQMLK